MLFFNTAAAALAAQKVRFALCRLSSFNTHHAHITHSSFLISQPKTIGLTLAPVKKTVTSTVNQKPVFGSDDVSHFHINRLVSSLHPFVCVQTEEDEGKKKRKLVRIEYTDDELRARGLDPEGV